MTAATLDNQPPTALRPPDFEALIRRHQLGLWRYLRSLGAPSDLAEDVMQDTFLVVMRRLNDDRGEAATATFLRQVGKHLLLRRRRDQSRREAILIELGAAAWTRECGTDDGEGWQVAVRDCVANLDGRAKEVVQRFYGDGQTREQIAADLGMKDTGVKTLLQRVRTLLRECIERRVRSGT